MRKIKILIVLEATLGGIRKHVIDLLLGLDKNKFDIIFAYSLNRADNKFIDDLIELKSTDISLYELNMVREINPLVDFRSFVALARLFLKERPDILHLHGAKAGALGRFLGIFLSSGVVYTPHGGSYHLFNGFKGKAYYFIEKFLSFKKFHYIGVSNDSVKKINLITKNPTNTHLVYNGIEPALNCKKKFMEITKNQNNDSLLVLFPALFMAAKGHLDFISAFYHHPSPLKFKIKIILAGDGPLMATIKNSIHNYGLNDNFEFVGFVNRMDIYYEKCDVVILPSKSEVFGYVLLESMSFGKPIIATNIDAIPELIVPGFNGELIDKNILNDMIDKLIYYSFNKKILFEMGRNSKKYVEDNFSLIRMIDLTQQIYCQSLHIEKNRKRLENIL